MDWPTLITTGKDLILAGAAITGSIVAVKGLSTWKRQLRGQAEYELAKRVLKATFQYRDRVYGVRHPVMWKYEMPQPPREEADRMTEQQINYYSTSKAYSSRWEKVVEIRETLYPELLEAKILWGHEIENLFKVLFEIERKLVLCIRHYLALINPDNSREYKDEINKIFKGEQDMQYDILNEDDDFRKKFSSGLKSIEQFISPYLKH